MTFCVFILRCGFAIYILCSLVVKRTSFYSFFVGCCFCYFWLVVLYTLSKRIERAFQYFYLLSICLVLDSLAFFTFCFGKIKYIIHEEYDGERESRKRAKERCVFRSRKKKSQSYGVASAPRFTYQHEKLLFMT